MAASSEVIAQALAQVDLGFAAFALGANSKRPVTLHGFKDATTDRERVAAQLSLPIAGNYGITWPEEADPVVVLDLDNGEDGRERPWQDRLLEHIEQIGPLPPTKSTTTPSGGRHAFYRWPADVPLPGGDELFGFTARWPGRGYLVGPGSSIDGVAYLPGPVSEIVPLPPEWVAVAVRDARPARNRGGFVTISGGRYELPERITSGQRYATIRDYVASRYNSGLPLEELWALVKDQVAPRFAVPLAEDELRDRFDRVVAKIGDRLGAPRGAGSQAPTIPPGPLNDAPLTEFDSRPIEWVWPGWLPRGVVTIMDGNPGVSKSTLVADLVARVTTGTSWPDGSPITAPGRVMWITTEDDPGRVLRPRIEAAGGDASRVRFVTGEVVFPASAGAFLELLVRRASEADGLVLVVLDPLFSHIEATVRTIADAEMRRGVMNPLNEAAEAANVACLVVRHFNKDTNASAINRGAGSLGGIVGAARALWSVVADPDDDETKVVGVSKLNYARSPAPWRYRVIDRLPPGWLTGTVSGIEWLGESNLSITRIMGQRTDSRDAQEDLRDILKDGPVGSKLVLSKMRVLGHGKDASTMARDRIGARAMKTGMLGGWVWTLDPEDAEESEDAVPDSSDSSSRTRAGAGGGTAPASHSSDSSKMRKDGIEGLFAGARTREGRCPTCNRMIPVSSLGTLRSHYPDGALTSAKWGVDPCPGSTQIPVDDEQGVSA